MSPRHGQPRHAAWYCPGCHRHDGDGLAPCPACCGWVDQHTANRRRAALDIKRRNANSRAWRSWQAVRHG